MRKESLRNLIKETGLPPLDCLEIMWKVCWNYEKALELSKEYTKWLN